MKTFGLSDVTDEELRAIGVAGAQGALEAFDRQVGIQTAALSSALGVELEGLLKKRFEKIVLAEMVKAMTDRIITL